VPELPDVEGFRRVLAGHAVGSRIDDVGVADSSVLIDTPTKKFQNVLHNNEFAEPWRYGKWLVAPLQESAEQKPAEQGKSAGQESDGATPAILFHFGMTGELVWAAGGQPEHRHDRVTFRIGDDELRYRDMRKLKGLRLTDTDAMSEQLDDLGPDAVRITKKQFSERFSGLSRQLKSALTDQGLIAGLGNLLADEICWQAWLHPRRKVNALDDAQLRQLHGVMRSVLKTSMRAGCVPGKSSWLTSRRSQRPGNCPRCGSQLCHGRVSSRSTVWCPYCQPSN
jgi:formamidopyrimidine-DNA glycosylase